MEITPPDASMVLETWLPPLRSFSHQSAESSRLLWCPFREDWATVVRTASAGSVGERKAESAHEDRTAAARRTLKERKKVDRVIWQPVEVWGVDGHPIGNRHAPP
jgi:hypothetical protein